MLCMPAGNGPTNAPGSPSPWNGLSPRSWHESTLSAQPPMILELRRAFSRRLYENPWLAGIAPLVHDDLSTIIHARRWFVD